MPLIADTTKALAAMLGVSARRITKWRAAHAAPRGLDSDDWLAWAKRMADEHPRVLYWRRLYERMPRPITVADLTAPPPDQTGIASILAPDADQPAHKLYEHYRAEKTRLQAEAERLRLAELERRLVPVERVEAAVAALATQVLEAMNDRVWRALLPQLVGLNLSPAVERSLRRAHDSAIVEFRADIATRGRAVLRGIFSGAPHA